MHSWHSPYGGLIYATIPQRDVADTRAVALTSTPTVYAKGGTVFASSRDVAAFFGKRHDNVVRDIQALIAGAPSCALNFEETSEAVAMPRGGTRQSPAYEMTRDGFTLLAMGFNGKTALAFKVRYIEEFNRMEAQLKGPVQPALPPTSWTLRNFAQWRRCERVSNETPE